MTSVTFNLKSNRSGTSVAYILGNCPELGNNDPANAIPLDKKDYSPYQNAVTINFETNLQDVSYRYFLKPQIGHTIYETVQKRFLPKDIKNGCVYDTFDVATSNAEVLVQFRIRCFTYFGQQLYVCGNIEELGNWKFENALLMNYENNADYWSASISLPISDKQRKIEYKYIVASNKDNLNWEPEKNHILEIGATPEPCVIEVADQYRWQDSTLDCFRRSTFVDVVNRRENPIVPPIIETEYTQPGKTTVFFSVMCPFVRDYQTVKVVGSIPELGNWNENSALTLADGNFPQWIGKVTIDSTHVPFEYKYIITGRAGEKVIWEMEQNRKYDAVASQVFDADFPKTLYINEWYVCPNRNLFKGLGIYCPVFSLRTDHSCGIGQYLDLKKLVDLCNKVGASMIQILPINDTTDKGEWADSYPYRQVSCFALHPVYIDLLEIAKLPEEIKEAIDKKKYELEQLPSVDYPAVYSFKMEMLKKIYALVDTSKDNDFKKFVEDNKGWLYPYSLYCYFRDKYGTSNFREWPEHSEITQEEVHDLCAQHAKDLDFIYWQQYVCDKQFKDAVQYAVQHRVALKGDLPIGVYLNSVECWAFPKNFRMNMCAGAPPDQFSGDGQNWFFPTYDWDYMASDNYSWWRMRLTRMAQLFHTLRVDHILGFFRIWEIPRATCLRGMLGHFFPAVAIPAQELRDKGLPNIDRYVKPYIRWHILQQKFGGDAYEVSQKYFNPRGWDAGDDYFDFKPEYDNEIKIAEAVKEIEDEGKRTHYQVCLTQLVGNVCLIEDDTQKGFYHVRTEVKMEHIEQSPSGAPIVFASSSWLELPDNERKAMEDLYLDFTYKRHNGLWVSKANAKLDILKNSTNMLICGEDLGQLTSGIINALKEKSLLSLRVQRMSKDPSQAFDDIDDYQYLSVCCPSTHDSTTLRHWWEENREETEKYWRDVLWRHDACPQFCETWIQEMIIRKHLWSNSMWAIFLLQDLTGITSHLRRQSPQDERINYPPDPNHKWRYRYPFTLDELSNDYEFVNHLHNMVIDSNRI